MACVSAGVQAVVEAQPAQGQRAGQFEICVVFTAENLGARGCVNGATNGAYDEADAGSHQHATKAWEFRRQLARCPEQAADAEAACHESDCRAQNAR